MTVCDPRLAVDEEPSSGAARWGGSLLVALGVHAAVAVGAVAWHVPMEPMDAEPPAVMIELAPLPAAPPEPTPALEAPPPEPVVEPPPPEPVIEEPPPPPEIVDPPPPPEPPPVVEPEVVIPKPPPEPPKPKPKPEPKKEPPKPRPEPPKPQPPRPTPQAVAPSAPSVPAPAPVAAAPAPSVAPSRSAPSWQGRVLGHLERHKRYPRSAQARRQEGVSQVRFVIDRNGKVLSVQLDKSAGYDSLDEETLEMVRRASPLPAPPDDMAQERIELVVPVQFFLK